MPGGLVALIDDVAALARLAAASVDDVAAAAGRAGSKTAGVVIDDAAVTPGYVVGLPPERELPIIGKIAAGSLRNKLVFILPVALLLSALAPWALTPILMAGGLYLCFEGAEKIVGLVTGHHATGEVAAITDPAELEARQVASAIRTDVILSAEIMVITLAGLADEPIVTQAVVLALVGIVVTVAVYGLVALLVKMDDIGLRLVRSGGTAATIGRGIVRVMPLLLKALSLIGTAAMLWVGGGILTHGAASFGFSAPEEWIHRLQTSLGRGLPAAQWLIGALFNAAVGVVAGLLVVALAHLKPGRHRQAPDA